MLISMSGFSKKSNMKTERVVNFEIECIVSIKQSIFVQDGVINHNYIGDKKPLLNGISILNGSPVLACAGWNMIVSLGQDGKKRHIYGGNKGIGVGRLKEPVAVVVAPDDRVFVPDWHNHRIVVLDENLGYLAEFGSFGKMPGNGSLHRFLKYLSILSSPGSYMPAHFDHESRSSCRRRKSLFLLVEGIKSRIFCHGGIRSWLKYVLSSEHAINKPNGVAFCDDIVVVTQKNNRCISVYKNEAPYKLLRHIFGPKDGVLFGRLGNITYHNGFFYVCDERAGVIWKLTQGFSFEAELKGRSSGTSEDCFLPFSCAMIDDVHLAVCGGRNIQIINVVTSVVVCVSESFGELHGLCFDANESKLYVVDRLNDNLIIFSIAAHDSKN